MPEGCAVYDMAGAPVAERELTLDASPVYLVSPTLTADELAAALME